jgi:hypothetical protein
MNRKEAHPMTDKMARTARVAPVTDDVIQHLADEAETG